MILKINSVFVFLITITIITIYLFQFNAQSAIELLLLIFLLVVSMVSIISFFYEIKIFKLIFYNLYFIFLFFIVVEFLLHLGIISNDFIKYRQNKVNTMVEVLNTTPWYKFHKNTIITSSGYRGENFIYSWKTDKYGFKNNHIENEYFAIALGDSFTEGMGVKINDTWTSILTRKNFKTYNAGVQGYAPSQYLGALKLLINDIKFENIFIGHLHHAYIREENFNDLSNIEKATGGIEKIRQKDNKINYIIFPTLLKYLFYQSKIYLSNQSSKLSKSIDVNTNHRFTKYANLVSSFISSVDIEDLKNDENWKRVIESYKEIIDIAENNNAKIYFIFFPTKTEIYFSLKDLNTPSVSDLQYYKEIKLIKEAFNDSNVYFIDPYNELKKFVSQNTERLPYHVDDGHLSKYGNSLIANKIIDFIKND